MLTVIPSLYLIPGSASPLTRICVEDKDVLLIYADHRARLWDSKTKELWRSMGQDKADELLAQGKWATLYVVNSDMRIIHSRPSTLKCALKGDLCTKDDMAINSKFV